VTRTVQIAQTQLIRELSFRMGCTGNRKDRMTIELAALATGGFVIFLILMLMSNKQRLFDKRLMRMQSEINDLRATESRRFLMDLNADKAHLVQPGAEVVSPATVEGPEVIPLVASRR
jgi:hypothetical protein